MPNQPVAAGHSKLNKAAEGKAINKPKAAGRKHQQVDEADLNILLNRR